MKKVLLMGAFATFGVLALSSCKKDYTCTITVGGVSSSTDYVGLTKAQAETSETACKLGGGTWAKK